MKIYNKGEPWDSIEYLLDTCSKSVRARPGNGDEDLLQSLSITFIKMRDELGWKKDDVSGSFVSKKVDDLDGWIPIEEYPNDGLEVIVGRYGCTSEKDSSYGYPVNFEDFYDYNEKQPTHFKYMPKAPPKIKRKPRAS